MTLARSYHFTHALARRPGRSVALGLRATDLGDPDADAFRREHGLYVAALRRQGLEVLELEPLEAYPDSVFVEDAALCVGSTAILLCPRAESRRGEVKEIRPALEDLFEEVIELPSSPGVFAEGGDILLTDREALVGLSQRTTRAGFEALSQVVEGLGYRPRQVTTPPGVLHFKTDCGLLDSETIFSTRRLASTGCFEGYRVIEAPVGEEAAANLIRVNDAVLLSAGYPRTEDLLDGLGYSLIPIPTREAARVDGGPSCLSLRFLKRTSLFARQ